MKKYIPIYSVRLVRESSIKNTYGKITFPTEAYRIFQDFLKDVDREYVVVMMLDNSNGVIGLNISHIGDLSSATFSCREIFKPAVIHNAKSVIICHNHPGNTVTPSAQDLNAFDKAKEAGNILNIQVLDFLIVTERSYYSFIESGRI